MIRYILKFVLINDMLYYNKMYFKICFDELTCSEVMRFFVMLVYMFCVLRSLTNSLIM